MIKATVKENVLYISTAYVVCKYELPEQKVLFKYLSRHGVSDKALKLFTKVKNEKAMRTLATTIISRILLTKHNKVRSDSILKFIKVFPSSEYFLIIKETMEDLNNDRINMVGIRVYKENTKLE
jgi:hypothetical protein